MNERGRRLRERSDVRVNEGETGKLERLSGDILPTGPSTRAGGRKTSGHYEGRAPISASGAWFLLFADARARGRAGASHRSLHEKRHHLRELLA